MLEHRHDLVSAYTPHTKSRCELLFRVRQRGIVRASSWHANSNFRSEILALTWHCCERFSIS